jgi:hypothetical protein
MDDRIKMIATTNRDKIALSRWSPRAIFDIFQVKWITGATSVKTPSPSRTNRFGAYRRNQAHHIIADGDLMIDVLGGRPVGRSLEMINYAEFLSHFSSSLLRKPCQTNNKQLARRQSSYR